MAEQYTIKINKRDGALEIVGPERAWVDEKLKELAGVYTEPLPSAENESGEGGEGGTKVQTKRPARRRKARTNPPKDGGGDEAGTSATKPRRRSSGGSRPQRNPELEALLTTEVKTSLSEYIAARQQRWDAKQTHQAAIVATFLVDELEWPGVDEDDMYTVYRVMGLDMPSRFKSQLQNATNRDKFFSGMTDGKYRLSVPGENYGRRTD